MSESKYPTATKYLKEIRALQSKLETLTQWIDPLSGESEEVTVRTFSARKNTLDSGEIDREILGVRRQLDERIGVIRQAIRRLSSPGEALLIELIYVFGLDAATVSTGLSLSRSGFYCRLSRSMLSLEEQLKRIDSLEGCAAPFQGREVGRAPAIPGEDT